MTEPHDIDSLRKAVKHRLVDLGLDRPGSYDLLVPHIRLRVSRNIISMAMTGYRSGPAALALLEEMDRVLAAWPPAASSPFGVDIHKPDA